MQNLKYIVFLGGTLSILVGCVNKQSEDVQKIIARIDINAKREPISKYMYGMFIEPLGNVDVGDLVDDGLWAEMLDDRKFFYPVDLNEELIPINKRDSMNQWTPVHDPKAVVMDSINSYVGIHTPKILANKNTPEGISQEGLAVVGNKKYVGRIVLSGSSKVELTISLIWGDGSDQRSDYKISDLTSEYTKYHFSLECKENSKNARLEITGLGAGSFSIGAASLMPEDNVAGFRSDVITLLKELNSGIYRWGGNMISGYDWRDGVGDPDQRPPRYEHAWEGMENNDVGTYEMIKFAELVNVELAITVNTGFGEDNAAAQWVEYVNGSKETPMGKLRTVNGHEEPFNIKLWCVGNESYGWWQLGHISLKDHIIKHNMFVEKMLAVDPSIKLIASGATIDEMTITLSAFKETGKILAEYDSASDWTGGMLRGAHHIDFMSEHFYCAVDQEFDIKKGKYVNVDEPLVDWTRRPANRVKVKAEHYKEYHKRIPGSEKIPVYLDEWTYFTNWVHPTPTLGVTIGHARALQEMFRNTDLIKMAGFTFGTSCLSFNDTDAIYNTSGMMFKLYQSQLGTIPISVNGSSPQPSPKWPVGGGQPNINAGGDTYPLDVVATLTSDQKALTIAVVNPTETQQSITFQFGGVSTSGSVKQFTISGTSSSARNIVGQPAEVSLHEITIEKTKSLLVEPATINIYRYELL